MHLARGGGGVFIIRHGEIGKDTAGRSSNHKVGREECGRNLADLDGLSRLQSSRP